MTRRMGIFLLTGLFLFGGGALAWGQFKHVPETPQGFQLLEEGFYALRKEAGVVVVEGADALLKLFAEDISPSKKPPVVVDFNRFVVVAVFAGSRSSGGYRLEITSARYENKGLDVRYVLHTPKPGTMTTQALTSPYAVILLEKPGPKKQYQAK